jgi:hypothetical protein
LYTDSLPEPHTANINQLGARIQAVLRGKSFMLNDELGMQLHDSCACTEGDRETTGETLTNQEKVQLEAWYAQKDAAEKAMLEAAQVPLPNLVTLQGLRHRRSNN